MTYKKTGLSIVLSLALGFTPLAAQTQKGKASYYSKRATGARSASGERLHHDSLTCAHRTHPFGTLLKVTNPVNNKEVIVKVTDRGPFHRGRLIDLSWRAAKELGILAQGIGTVKVEVYQEAGGIPFLPSEKQTFSEMDFEITESEYSFAEDWAESLKEAQSTQIKTPEQRKKATHTKPESHTAKHQQATHKPATTAKPTHEKKENNLWNEMINKLKELGH